MPELTLKTYAQYVHRSKLVPRDQLQTAITSVQRQQGALATDYRPLARLLVQQGLLTEWQHGKLRKGRYKGFFLGKYKLLDHLGRGGMGHVFLAEHTVMLRRVALKILPERLVNDKAALEQFYRESQAIAAQDHPNMVRAYDVDNEGDIHYLVMEYVDGPDLDRRVRESGPLAPDLAADYVYQVSEGLAHAHAKGIIHRDIKPGNLLVSSEGVVKILDMGLAVLTDYGDSQQTDISGTADYMAPEQALSGKPIDHRADLYSLGCTLYFLLTGSAPFGEQEMHAVLLKHQTEEPPTIQSRREGVPDDLVAICSKLMAKDPDARYQSATEVAEVLHQWLTQHQAWTADPAESTRRSSDEVADVEAFLTELGREHAQGPGGSNAGGSGADHEDSLEFRQWLEQLPQPEDASDQGSDPGFWAQLNKNKPAAPPPQGSQPTKSPAETKSNTAKPSEPQQQTAKPSPQQKAAKKSAPANPTAAKPQPTQQPAEGQPAPARPESAKRSDPAHDQEQPNLNAILGKLDGEAAQREGEEESADPELKSFLDQLRNRGDE